MSNEPEKNPEASVGGVAAGYVFSCLICGAPVPGYVLRICCTGRDCGCEGKPVEPCTCSRECDEALFSNIGVPMEERRIRAGIPRHNDKPSGRSETN